MGFFKKDRKMFGMSFLVRMCVVVVAVIVGVSGSVVMADWVVEENGTADQLFIDDAKESSKIFTKRFFIDNIGSAHLVLNTRNDDNSFKDWWQLVNYNGYLNFWSYTSSSTETKYPFTISNQAPNYSMRILTNGSVCLGGNSSTQAQGNLLINRPTNNSHWDALSIQQIGGWSAIPNKHSNIKFSDGTGVVGAIGVTYDGYGRVDFHSLYNSGYKTDNDVVMSISGNGTVIINGTTSSTRYACSSDARYKKNVSLYSNALEKVLGLRGVTYFWNTEKYKDRNFSKDKQLGFIAQEVEKIIPEIVYTDSKGYKTMSYDRLSVVLVEAMKELKVRNDERDAKSQKEIAVLKEKDKQKDKRITALESENEKMKADNTALKQRLAKFESLADRLALVEKELQNQKSHKLAER